MPKTLRNIELDDLKELQIMLQDFWSTQLVEASKADILEDIRRMLSPKCYSYLLDVDGETAGFIHVDEKYGYVNNIEYLYIKPEFRGQGLGSFILDEIKKILFADGLERVQIEANPSNLKLISAVIVAVAISWPALTAWVKLTRRKLAAREKEAR